MSKKHTFNLRNKALLALGFLFTSTTLFSQNDDFDRIQKVVAGDRAADEQYGYTVSINGNYAAVGAPYSTLDANGLNSIPGAGSVYILEKNNSGVWIQVIKVTAPIRSGSDNFGIDVDLSGGNLIVGATGEQEDANELNPIGYAGAAFIFERDGSGNWNFIQKITPTIRAAGDVFGNSVSISNNRAIISSPYNDTDVSNLNPINDAGAVYAFEKNGSGVWVQIQKIVAPDRANDDAFGRSCDISDNYFVVGAPLHERDEDNLNPISDAGAAYIYSWGTPITFFHKRVAFDRKYIAHFGASVAIESSILAISADGESYDENNLNPVNEAGAVYAYNLLVSPFLAFHFYDKMVAPDRYANDHLGRNIDISGYHIIASSVNGHDNSLSNSNYLPQAGSAYVFERTSGYNYLEKLTANKRDPSDYFGTSVAISSNADGLVAFVNCGYDFDDENEANPLSYTGSAFIFGACIPSSNSITVTACNNYDFHGNYHNTSGIYVDTIPNAIGCDSLVTINLSIYATDTTLSYLNGFVQSNQGNATYQWINCQTGLAVPGATSQIFYPTVNGLYKVVIYPTAVSCSDTSECVFINNAGIGESTISNFTVFPNPSSKEITISGEIFIQSFSIQALNGEIVEQVDLSNHFTKSHSLDVTKLSKGIYFMKITAENSKTDIIKISIQ